MDPDGNYLEVSDNGDGTFIIIGGEVNSDKNIYIMNDGVFSGILGQMMTESSFFDEGLLVKGAIIDCNDTSGADFINNFEENTPDIFSYIDNARNGKAYDFKDLGKSNLKGIDLNKYRHRGMPLGNNIGNILEVKEAIEILNNRGNSELREVCVTLATYMVMIGKNISFAEAKIEVINSIESGSALNKFKELIITEETPRVS